MRKVQGTSEPKSFFLRWNNQLFSTVELFRYLMQRFTSRQPFSVLKSSATTSWIALLRPRTVD